MDRVVNGWAMRGRRCCFLNVIRLSRRGFISFSGIFQLLCKLLMDSSSIITRHSSSLLNFLLGLYDIIIFISLRFLQRTTMALPCRAKSDNKARPRGRYITAGVPIAVVVNRPAQTRIVVLQLR